ncbi:DUF3455 domain-containing protein [Acetobacter persici]|uniref:DUF3455 domain-containing protein n=1 Tax=Acetobacter persici TaxID=1076596 RepID=UPI0036DAFCC2
MFRSGVAFAREVSDTASGSRRLTLHAQGQQIYMCLRAPTGGLKWTLIEPAAELFEGDVYAGVHSIGPSWFMSDNSYVRAKVLSMSSGVRKTDIPYLHMEITEQGGNGRLRGVHYVDRLQTLGGALSGPCEIEDMSMGVPYKATYVFSYQ